MDEIKFNLDTQLFQIFKLQNDLQKLLYLVKQAQSQINHPDSNPEEISQAIQEMKGTIPKLDLCDIPSLATEFEDYPTDQVVADMAAFNTQLVEFNESDQEFLPSEIAERVALLTLNQQLLKVVTDQLFHLKYQLKLSREESVSYFQYLENWYQESLRELGIVKVKVNLNQGYAADDDMTGEDVAAKQLTPKSQKSDKSKRSQGGVNSRKNSHTPSAKGLDGFSSLSASKSGILGRISPKKFYDLSTQPSTNHLLTPSLQDSVQTPSLPAQFPSKLNLDASQQTLNNSPSILSQGIKSPQSPKSALKIKIHQVNDSRASSRQSDDPSQKGDVKNVTFPIPEKQNITEKSKFDESGQKTPSTRTIKTAGVPLIPKRYSVFDPTGKAHNQMATNCLDLTHDSPLELYWRPIIRAPEKKPGENVLKDKLLLKDWEMTQLNEFYSYIWDRRVLDQEIIRRFKMQGDIIKATSDTVALGNDSNFWKMENENNQLAYIFIKEMRKLRPYDHFNIQPEVYDMRSKQGEKGSGGVPGAADDPEGQKKGGLAAIVEEAKKELEEQEDDDINNFSMIKNKKDDEQRQAGQLNVAVDEMGKEATAGGILFSRGPEVEIAGNKEVENLMSVLTKLNIHLSNKVLQRAMVMPKDREQNAASYPSVRDSLFHNPFGTAEYKRKEAALKKAQAAAAAAAQKAKNAAAKKENKKKKANLETVNEAPAAMEGHAKGKND